MLTVCPKCTLTLAVSAGDLRVGQGYVRCGRCTTVFNALLSLRDAAAEAEAAPLESEINESLGNTTVETIVLEGDGVLQTEEFVDIGTINQKIADATRLHGQTDVRDEPGVAAEPDAPYDLDAPALPPGDDSMPEHWLHDEEADDAAPEPSEQELEDALEQSLRADAAPSLPQRRRQSLLWAVAAALLVVVAGLQLIHHWRNELSLNASWYHLLRGPYQQLGLPLNPQWNLESYDLRQLGGGTDDRSRTLRIQLSLANRAQSDLPFPVLRLALYNRFGKRLLTRDLTASDYLSPAMHSGEFMARAQRYDTEFGIANLATDVASFELDVCLPAARGMRCASDQPRT
jgi:predicted Zn finger-like uncharacterized protein